MEYLHGQREQHTHHVEDSLLEDSHARLIPEDLSYRGSRHVDKSAELHCRACCVQTSTAVQLEDHQMTIRREEHSDSS